MAVDKKKMLSLLDQIEQAMPELKELAGGEDDDDGEQEPDEDDQGPPPDDGSGMPPDDGSGLPGQPPMPPMGKKKPY